MSMLKWFVWGVVIAFASLGVLSGWRALGEYGPALVSNVGREIKDSLPISGKKFLFEVQRDAAKAVHQKQFDEFAKIEQDLKAVQETIVVDEQKVRALDKVVAELAAPDSRTRIGETYFTRNQLENERKILLADAKAQESKAVRLRVNQSKMREALGKNAARLTKLEIDSAEILTGASTPENLPGNAPLDAAESTARELRGRPSTTPTFVSPTPAADAMAAQQS